MDDGTIRESWERFLDPESLRSTLLLCSLIDTFEILRSFHDGCVALAFEPNLELLPLVRASRLPRLCGGKLEAVAIQTREAEIADLSGEYLDLFA